MNTVITREIFGYVPDNVLTPAVVDACFMRRDKRGLAGVADRAKCANYQDRYTNSPHSLDKYTNSLHSLDKYTNSPHSLKCGSDVSEDCRRGEWAPKAASPIKHAHSIEKFTFKRASQPYQGLAQGITPNPLQAVLQRQTGGQQPVAAAQPGLSPHAIPGMPTQVTPGSPPGTIAAQAGPTAAQAQRGYNNTPIKQTSGTAGAPGRPPTRKKMSHFDHRERSVFGNKEAKISKKPVFFNAITPIPQNEMNSIYKHANSGCNPPIVGPMSGLGSGGIGKKPPVMMPMNTKGSTQMGGMSGMGAGMGSILQNKIGSALHHARDFASTIGTLCAYSAPRRR